VRSWMKYLSIPEGISRTGQDLYGNRKVEGSSRWGREFGYFLFFSLYAFVGCCMEYTVRDDHGAFFGVICNRTPEFVSVLSRMC
jgi:nuclear transport factor 2 (NTF2) superfamily protein